MPGAAPELHGAVVRLEVEQCDRPVRLGLMLPHHLRTDQAPEQPLRQAVLPINRS